MASPVTVAAVVAVDAGACSISVSNAADLRSADIVAGMRVCVGGAAWGEPVVIRKSGTEQAPIVIDGGGTTVAGINVRAAHVVVSNFRVVGGDGIVLRGDRLVARGNTVIDAADHGISCERCTNLVIDGNVIERADGSGLWISGTDLMVERNRISGSVMKKSNDADGIRFFGERITIRANTIEHIKDDGYPQEPHTDCFQTFDNSKPATRQVLIEGNICNDVDHQCLIATAAEAKNAGKVGRSSDIVFKDNVCNIEGSQAVLVDGIPNVHVVGNQITGPNMFRGVILLGGSTGGLVQGNTFVGDFPMFEVSEDSKAGFSEAGNVHANTR